MSEEERLERVSVPELDAVLGRKFPVLDDGFVRAVDYMGGDASIVQAARVSYGKGTKAVHEDRGLIRYLLRHRHTTPFEMCELKLHVRVPMDTWRQWVRHRTASINEYSTRYSIAIDSAERTAPGDWRLQAKGNRQGSEGRLDHSVGGELSREEEALHESARKVYKRRVELGVARERARKDLPLSTYTEAYWKIDLHNLLRFLNLRMDPAAQREIRSYAELIGRELVARWAPLTWEAFLDYEFDSERFSGRELALLRLFVAGKADEAFELAKSYGWLEWDERKSRWKRNRERGEFVAKVKDRLGFEVSWKQPVSPGRP